MISINGTEISFKGRFLSVGEIEGPAQVNFSLFEARTEVSCSLSALQAVGPAGISLPHHPVGTILAAGIGTLRIDLTAGTVAHHGAGSATPCKCSTGGESKGSS